MQLLKLVVSFNLIPAGLRKNLAGSDMRKLIAKKRWWRTGVSKGCRGLGTAFKESEDKRRKKQNLWKQNILKEKGIAEQNIKVPKHIINL